MQRKPQVNTGSSLDDFIMGAKDVKTDVTVKKEPLVSQEETDLNTLRRQTYYITELYIQAIEQMAFYEKMDKSKIVRKALEEYIPKKYINLAIKK